MDRLTKVEESLKEHIDIIQTVNKKVNANHDNIDDVKQVVQNKIARLEDEAIGKKNAMVPGKWKSRALRTKSGVLAKKSTS